MYLKKRERKKDKNARKGTYHCDLPGSNRGAKSNLLSDN
jgi:hypothetical protein